MAVATVARAPSQVETESSVVTLLHVSWDTYERLLADDEERRVPRMTFDRGVLELVSPSQPYEEDAGTVTELVSIIAAHLQVPIRSIGSTTFKRRDLERGFEPDSSFYIQHELSIRGRRQVDLGTDPPPDVVLEMEVSRTAVDKLGLFAAMGVPEVWRSDGRRVTVLVLDQGTYRTADRSSALPALTTERFEHFLTARLELLSHEWFQMVSDWAREQTKAEGD